MALHQLGWRALRRVHTSSSRILCFHLFSTLAKPSNEFIEYYSSSDANFGDYKSIASESSTIVKKYHNPSILDNPDYAKSKVWIRGRVSSVRVKGNACFIVIRSNALDTIQACHFKGQANGELSKQLIKFIGSISLESIVDVYGEVVPAKVHSCTQKNVEIYINKIFIVSRAPAILPFLLEDASRFVSISSFLPLI